MPWPHRIKDANPTNKKFELRHVHSQMAQSFNTV